MSTMNKDIVKSNALIEAVYNPGSVYQMRLLMAALMQVKAKEKLDYKTRYFVSANALADLTGSKAKNNYSELRKAADELMNTQVIVTEAPDGTPLGKRLKINLTSSCEYLDDEGTVGLRFTDEITPYVSELKKRFTKYQAKYVMPMRSSYGIRLYELCLGWMGDEREFTVEEFRKMFGLEEKYKAIKDLKKDVVFKAISDINTYSDIRVRFGQRKTGRRVTHFQFAITKPVKNNRIVPLDFEKWATRYGMTEDKGFPDWAAAKKALGRTYAAYKKDPISWVKKNGSDEAYRRLLEESGQSRLVK